MLATLYAESGKTRAQEDILFLLKEKQMTHEGLGRITGIAGKTVWKQLNVNQDIPATHYKLYKSALTGIPEDGVITVSEIKDAIDEILENVLALKKEFVFYAGNDLVIDSSEYTALKSRSDVFIHKLNKLMDVVENSIDTPLHK